MAKTKRAPQPKTPRYRLSGPVLERKRDIERYDARFKTWRYVGVIACDEDVARLICRALNQQSSGRK